MSNDALKWAFALRMTDASAKAVLIALADHADDNGRCWPSAERLVLFTALSDKTVRMAVKRLAEMGAIGVEARAGKPAIYTLKRDCQGDLPRPQLPTYPGSDDRPTPVTVTEVKKATPVTVTDLPRSQLPDTPVNDASTPVTVTDEPSKNPQEPPVEPPIGKAPKNARPAPAARGARLPTDWQPDPACVAYAVERGLDAPETASAFRDYWHASSSPGAVKLDWNAAWRTWCRSPYNQRRPAGDHRGANGTDFSRGGGGFVGAAQRYAKRRGLAV